MRVIVHLSDLHFGRTDPRLVSGVRSAIEHIAPDLVAVSGDLTQRARRWQFRQARRFLDALPFPRLVVPGNHDVPLYNVVARFAFPLRGFRRCITANLRPCHVDDELAVLGANTTRSFTIKDGGFRLQDVDAMSRCLATLDRAIVKVVVCHHPFDAPSGHIGRYTTPAPAADAMSRLLASGADIFLTGHLHVSYTGGTAHRYHMPGCDAIVVEAGTATSTRTRGESNSFNVIRADRTSVVVERHDWVPRELRFACAATQRFVKGGQQWLPSPPVESA